ncbi:MAG: hypothetical protein IJY42_06040 [Clostridia bacterium]|nr:hypothetical protein [Clostridia bacterium]
MVALATSVFLGLLIVILGGINTAGNISSLHWYHRQRVTEEDRKPFGRMVGIGHIIIGNSIILFGCLFFCFERTEQELLVIIGTVLLLVGIAAGLVICLAAMMKYNKGIF